MNCDSAFIFFQEVVGKIVVLTLGSRGWWGLTCNFSFVSITVYKHLHSLEERPKVEEL